MFTWGSMPGRPIRRRRCFFFVERRVGIYKNRLLLPDERLPLVKRDPVLLGAEKSISQQEAQGGRADRRSSEYDWHAREKVSVGGRRRHLHRILVAHR